MLLAGLAMLGPFTINTYMPSFPEMKTVFGVTDVELQLTLSLYFASFAFMSLWHGAISDSLGRRPVVMVGLVVFALASLGAAAATSIEQVYVCRVLQGLSAGAGIVIGRAVIRDLYEGAAAQRLYALVIMLFALAPAIGPLLGGWLQVHLGWRASFGFLALLGALLLGLVVGCLPETLPSAHRHPFSAKALLEGYRQVLRNVPFLLWAGTFALMFAGFFIYVLSAPVFLMRHLGLAETDFIWLFGPATAGMMAGSWLSGRVAQHWSVGRCLATGFGIMGGAALWNLSICYWAPTSPGWYLPYLFIYTLGMALVQPTITLSGLDCVPDRRGLGSSVQLFTQTGFNAVLSAIIAPFFWSSPLKLAGGAALVMVLALGGMVLAWTATRRQAIAGAVLPIGDNR
ncbi:multidrug effflux MFS transporter [Pseudomonas lopnurensis]|uniref:multidrug effflux MFS transporter n=1 Tax=Pseudomonas lopnurensis TaxID=1477517 RepID=UPI0028ADD8D6|nr:multidrug effflux MFS transporter [Pseudomonas lopnurensis]